MPSRRASVTGSNLMSSTVWLHLFISTEEPFFINMIKSNQLKIITRDAGASGRHSHAGAWERESNSFNLLFFCHFWRFFHLSGCHCCIVITRCIWLRSFTAFIASGTTIAIGSFWLFRIRFRHIGFICVNFFW